MPGSAIVRNTRSASTPAAPAANCSGIPNGIASRVSTGLPNVITEDEAIVAPVRGGLVAEHPALGVAREVDVLPGRRSDPVDGVGDGEHVVGERSLESPLLLLRGAEVDDPRIGPVLAQDRDRARRRRDVVDLGGEHHRRDEQDRRAVIGRPRRPVAARRVAVAPSVGVVPPQPVDALLGDDLVRRRFLVGRQSAEPRHLERVLSGAAKAADRPRDLLWQEVHWNPAHLRRI